MLKVVVGCGDWVVLDVDCGWFSSNLWFLHGHSHLAPIGGVFLFEFIYLFIFMFCNGFCGLCDGRLRFWWWWWIFGGAVPQFWVLQWW